jgi:DNA modification methylase
MTVRVLQGHALDVLATLPARSVHVCVTSPPYWGLRAYGTPPQTWGDGWSGELGSEPTLDLFVAHLLEVFAAVGRVLRDDGTLWVNLGDSYASKPNSNKTDRASQGNGSGVFRVPAQRNFDARWAASQAKPAFARSGLRDGDLCMAPARFALAMQAAGWRLRSEITLCKTAPMPESVQGARWERCRVKTAPQPSGGTRKVGQLGQRDVGSLESEEGRAEWADCPGCPRCEATDGLVQRWGSGRPTSATEKLYVFAKGSGAYFYDVEGVKVKALQPEGVAALTGQHKAGDLQRLSASTLGSNYGPTSRNLWNYVMWAPEPLRAAHYAAYPRWLPRLAIQAGTSERGCCPTCGAPWLRAVSREAIPAPGKQGPSTYEGMNRENDRWPSGTPVNSGLQRDEWNTGTTVGWRQSCRCAPHEPAPCTALDPFSGSGTTVIEANALGRHGIGIELQEKYVDIAHQRLRGQPLSLFAQEAAG